jgi:hypothetical protein
MGRPRIDADRTSTYKRPSARRTSSSASINKSTSHSAGIQKANNRDIGKQAETGIQHDVDSPAAQELTMDDYLSILQDGRGCSFSNPSNMM